MKNGIKPAQHLLDQYRLVGVGKSIHDNLAVSYVMFLESMSNPHTISLQIEIPPEALEEYDWGCSDLELTEWVKEADEDPMDDRDEEEEEPKTEGTVLG